MQRIFKLYKKVLVKWPLFTESVQTGSLMGVGDLISQILIEKKAIVNVDHKRTLQFSSIGLLVGGPALRFWYGFLNRRIGSSGKTVAVKKVIIDQVIFAPSFVLILLAAVGTVQGKSMEMIKKDIQADYFDVLKTNYYIWPWVQLLNFHFVPLQYQVLVVQIVEVFWTTYISWKTNTKRVETT